MKKILFISFVIIANLCAFAEPSEIVIKSTNNGQPDRAPDDMPAVFYDADTEQIIVDGGGVVSYYDVEIISQSTMMTVVSTVVNGYYGIIDVSSVPAGDYTIVITSPNNNVYVGDFSI
jgi:hypothetical protein